MADLRDMRAQAHGVRRASLARTRVRRSGYNAAMATAAAAKPALSLAPQSRPLRYGAMAALICGLLLLLGAGATAIGFSRAAILEQEADDGWPMVGCEVINERTGQHVAVTDLDGNVTWEFQLQPQIEVRYVINGVTQKTWVDVPCAALNSSNSSHHNVAERALAPYHPGQRIACYWDPADSSSLRLAISDGGRRTAVKGFILAGILCVPSVGLILTSWLLWRAGGAGPASPRMPAHQSQRSHQSQ